MERQAIRGDAVGTPSRGRTERSMNWNEWNGFIPLFRQALMRHIVLTQALGVTHD
jgi:hypothetical protein